MLPLHTNEELVEAVTVSGAMVIVVVALLCPQPLVPVTVYTVVAAGKKLTPFVTVDAPPAHVYVSAPLAVKVAVLPTQIPALELAVLTIDNDGTDPFTVILTDAEELHPAVLVPVTE